MFALSADFAAERCLVAVVVVVVVCCVERGREHGQQGNMGVFNSAGAAQSLLSEEN